MVDCVFGHVLICAAICDQFSGLCTFSGVCTFSAVCTCEVERDESRAGIPLIPLRLRDKLGSTTLHRIIIIVIVVVIMIIIFFSSKTPQHECTYARGIALPRLYKPIRVTGLGQENLVVNCSNKDNFESEIVGDVTSARGGGSGWGQFYSC